VEKGITADEFPRAVDGMAISERFRLRNEADGAAMAAGSFGIAFLIARPHHYADLLDMSVEGLFHQDSHDGFFLPIVIDQGLERKSALVFPGSGDDGFLDLQAEKFTNSFAESRLNP
jgi:hypothetical protein